MNYNYLPRYSFGNWLKKNAGTVGTVAGASIGTLIAPGIGTTLGASIGGQLGGSVQQDYQQDQQAEIANEQIRQQARNVEIANMRAGLNNPNNLQQNNFAGTNNFAYGGGLKNGDKTVLSKYATDTGKQFYPVWPTESIIKDTVNYFPITAGDFGRPVYGTFNSKAIDTLPPNVLVKENLTSKGLSYSDSILKRLSENPPTEGYLRSRPKVEFPGLAYGGMIKKMAYGGSMGFANGGNIENYQGQTHEGENGGIPVTPNGTPSVINGEKPTALVEDGETSWKDPESGQVYIFSNRILI